MNYRKLTLLVIGANILVGSLLSVSVSALSATVSLSGASNNTGSFAVTIYEDTGTNPVTGANVVLDFSTSVSNVTYDYSVGPFTATTPSGMHDAYGTVTGMQPVAIAHFTLPHPATVTAAVDQASYLKYYDSSSASVQSYVLTRGSADFIYTAPAVKPAPQPSSPNTTVQTHSTTAPATTNDDSSSSAEVKGTSTGDNPSSDDKKASNTPQQAVTTASRSTSNRTTWIVSLLIILVAAVAAFWYSRSSGNKSTTAAADNSKTDAKKVTAAPSKSSEKKSGKK